MCLGGGGLLLGGGGLLVGGGGLLLGLGYFSGIRSFDYCGGHDGGPAANAKDRVCFGRHQDKGTDYDCNLDYRFHKLLPVCVSGW